LQSAVLTRERAVLASKLANVDGIVRVSAIWDL
jgi:hypothetical protein